MEVELENRPLTAPESANLHKDDRITVSQVDEHKASSSPPPAATWWRAMHNSGWVWECLCCILVVGALAALFIVLDTAQDQPMAAWRQRHSNISINAVVAVLSALLKGAFMFIVAEGALIPRLCWLQTRGLRVEIHRPDQMAVVRERS